MTSLLVYAAYSSLRQGQIIRYLVFRASSIERKAIRSLKHRMEMILNLWLSTLEISITRGLNQNSLCQISVKTEISIFEGY